MLYNPRDRRFIEDPYPTYAVLRDTDPVHRSFFGAWIVTRYEDVKAGFLDSRLRTMDLTAQIREKSDLMAAEMPDAEGRAPLHHLIVDVEHWMAFMEAPDHSRMRGEVADRLRKPALEKLRPTIREIAKQLIDRVYATGHIDLIGDFAQPLPARVLGHLLGIAQDDIPTLTRWMSDLIPVIDPLTPFSAYREMETVSRDFLAYLERTVALRRAAPQDDLISDMANSPVGLTARAIAGTCVQLFGAGVQTSTNLFANGIVALLKHPDCFAELKSDLSLVATANEELLRYDPSLQFAARTATEDLVIAGTAIAAHQTVFLTIAAANRDPRRFNEPDRLNLRRKDNPHLSFGAGRHFCVGGALARIEAQEAMTLLAEMLPGMRLAGDRQPFMESGVAVRRRPRLDIVF